MPSVPHLYEVTIDVPESLAERYSAWLDDHVAQMKTVLFGITKVEVVYTNDEVSCPADVAIAEFKDKPYSRLIAKYYVESKEQIDDYIANRSAPMRSAAIDTFGQQVFSCFRFSRRIVPVSEE